MVVSLAYIEAGETSPLTYCGREKKTTDNFFFFFLKKKMEKHLLRHIFFPVDIHGVMYPNCAQMIYGTCVLGVGVGVTGEGEGQ